MKFKNLAIIFFVVFTFTSCSSDDDEVVSAETSLVGSWESTSIYLKRVQDGKILEESNTTTTAEKDKIGFVFRTDGTGDYKFYENKPGIEDLYYRVIGNKVRLQTDPDFIPKENEDFDYDIEYTWSIKNNVLTLDGVATEDGIVMTHKVILKKI